MPQGLRKEQAQLLAAMLRDPDYWGSFMKRSREPLFVGGPSLGALVPGLGSYQMTTDAMNAYGRGDYEAASSHAIDAATQLIPAGAIKKLSPFKGRQMIPTPGLTTTATRSPEEEQERLRKWKEWRYNNPALKSEYWKDLPKDWRVPGVFKSDLFK